MAKLITGEWKQHELDKLSEGGTDQIDFLITDEGHLVIAIGPEFGKDDVWFRKLIILNPQEFEKLWNFLGKMR